MECAHHLQMLCEKEQSLQVAAKMHGGWGETGFGIEM
jgi:hypothetical protein